MEPSKRSRRAACTIIARNYLARARVVAESYLQHEPDGQFFVLVVDGLPDGIELGPCVVALGPNDVDIPEFVEMAFKYDVTELCTAVKPALLSCIFQNYNVDCLVYFDPDIAIFRPLDEMWALLAASDIVLIPHLLDPIPLDGKRPSEQDILTAGAYNLGFIGLHASSEVQRMLDWWNERLRDHCRVDVAHGLFVDQKWIDLVPSLFPNTAILRDPSYDVAYWNLHSRRLERGADHILVNGRPLAFFHYSGFDPLKPRELSKHQDRLTVDESSPLAHLLDSYVQLVHGVGFALTRAWPYGYAIFDNGVPVSLVHRHLFGSLDAARRRQFGDPFETGRPESFFQWASRPAPQLDGLSPFLERLLIEAQDARAAFPEARGRQQKAFLTWAQTHGATAFGYDGRLADPTGWRQVGVGPMLTSGSSSLTGPVEGVNVYGYLRNETGLGAVARGFIGALRSVGVPLGLTDLAELSSNRSLDTTLGRIDGSAPYAINLVCVNADQHFVVKSHVGEHAFSKDHYNIGVWFWELPSFPNEWLNRFDDYDEIWAASSFIANTLAAVSPVPVVRVPPVLFDQRAGSREAGRNRLGIGPDTFVFLFIFDFASYFERKNPLATIRAFTQAFPRDDDVHLVIKCVNEHLDPESFAQMQTTAGAHPVSVFTGYWTSEQMRDLMAACDAYVSLHRSEGLGLPIAEAMALGKPVIATAWSGNTDFMTISNSFPVPCTLVELTHDVGPYRAGAVWADPSVDDAARLMRVVRDEPTLAQSRAEAGKRDLQTQYSERQVGRMLQGRLSLAAARQRSRRAQPAEPRPAPAASVPSVPPMDLEDSSHGWLGVLAKRGMNFLLRYHTHYQGEINLKFAAFMRELQVEQESHATQLAAARQHTAALDAGLAALATVPRDLARLDGYFSARPYMARDAYATAGDLHTPMGYAEPKRDALADGAAPDFADLFRGSEEFIRDRQRVYLQFCKAASKVVDLGSGRGEFLDLLREQGVDAVGVELDPSMVERCRGRGLCVEHADAFEYLERLPRESVDVIFSAQFVEHVESSRLAELLELARGRLRPRGLFIAETVNPESYLAQKTFFVDLSHQRPIFPQVLLHMCQTSGYASARIFYPGAGGFTQLGYREAGEYAVVAIK